MPGNRSAFSIVEIQSLKIDRACYPGPEAAWSPIYLYTSGPVIFPGIQGTQALAVYTTITKVTKVTIFVIHVISTLDRIALTCDNLVVPRNKGTVPSVGGGQELRPCKLHMFPKTVRQG